MTKDAPNPEDPPPTGAAGDSPAEEQEIPEEGPAAAPTPPGETGTASADDPAEPESPPPAEESSAEPAGSTESTAETPADGDPTDPAFTAAGGAGEPGDSRPEIAGDLLPATRMEPPRRAPWMKGVLDLCLILILAGLAGAVYLLYQMQLDQDQIILAEVDRLESRLNDLEARPQLDAQARRSLQVLDKKLKSLRQRLGKIHKRQDRDLHQLKEQMASLTPAETPAEPGATPPVSPIAEAPGITGEPAPTDAAAPAEETATEPAATAPEEAAATDSRPAAGTDEGLDGSSEAAPDSTDAAGLSAAGAGEAMDADAANPDEAEPLPQLAAAATEEPGAPGVREAEPVVTQPKAPQQKYIEFVESTAHQLWDWVKATASQLWDWIVRKLQGAWKA